MPTRILTLLTILALLASSAFAQPPEANVDAENGAGEETYEGGFVEIVDVNVVNVEVYVTDKKGNRIQGLTKDDFKLEVDGKPMAITNFFAVEDGTPKGDGIDYLPPPEEKPGRRALNEDVPPVPEDQKLHLIIYVDNLNIRPFNRNKAFRFIRTFLRDRVTPYRDDVMLVTFERSMHIRHPFTSDPELVASALYDIETHSGQGVHYDSDRRDIMDVIYDDTNEEFYNVRGRAVTYAESLYNDMIFTIRSVEDMIETLAGLPGRKAILYVSDGISMRPGEDVFYALNDRFQGLGGSQSVLMEIHRFDLSRDFMQLTNKANANRVTFYTLDSAGLRTYSYMQAQNASAGGGSFIDQIHFSNLQGPLIFMAQETGGTVIMNTNNFTKGLDKIADDFSNYYSLGFSSAEAASGRYHKIKVSVPENKKLEVRHREGYRDKPVSTRMAEGTLASLHFGYQKNEIGIEIEIGTEEPDDRRGNRFMVPISINFPIGELSFLPQDDFQRGRVRLYVAARDEEGGLSPVQNVEIPIDIPTDQFEQAKEQDYRYEMKLQMRRGRQVLAVGVHDEIGATKGFVSRGVSIGGRGGRGR